MRHQPNAARRRIPPSVRLTPSLSSQGRADKTATSRQRAGTTLVEFALVAPVIFALFFASIEFARVNMLRHAIESAAYEACRAVIVPGATAADGLVNANTTLAAASAIDATVTFDPPTITNQTKNVTVTVSLPLNRNTWITPDFFKDITISTSINMNREYLDEYASVLVSN